MDGSSTSGFLAKEKFTLTNTDVFDKLNFGCGVNNQGFKGIAGLLGLGPGTLSFPSQTAMTYNNIFSYCLPSSKEYTGHLTFGSGGISNSVKYTQSFTLLVNSGGSFYSLDIVGISVANKDLNIPLGVFSNATAIIDSGTTITRLPPVAYAALRTAFKEKMSNYKTTLGPPPFDTCYDFTGLRTMSIPKISFSFDGGTVVDLDSKGVMYMYGMSKGMSKGCLGFAGNTYNNNVAVFGSLQQKTLEVVYDVQGGRLGFAPNGCR